MMTERLYRRIAYPYERLACPLSNLSVTGFAVTAPLVGEPLAGRRVFGVWRFAPFGSADVMFAPAADDALGAPAIRLKNESFAKGSPIRGAVTAKLVTERLYKAEHNRYQKSSPFRGSWENYMGVKPFSTAASRPCPAHRGRCARQWCSRSAAGPHCTRRWDTWRAERRGSASRAACPRRHRSHSPP